MNRDEFEGSWHQLKGKIREKWGKFTNDDLTKINGKYEQFMGQLQKKYGYSKEQAEREMKNWQNTQQTRYSDTEREGSWGKDKFREEVVQEDTDTIDTFGSEKKERSEGQSPWKQKEQNKDRKDDDDYKQKKRKVS